MVEMSVPSAFDILHWPLRWLGHQRWLRYGLRNRLLCRIHPPERAAPRGFEVPFAGYIYPGNFSRWIDWIVYYYGGYELDELELLRDLASSRDGPVALDIGANVGHHTLYLASFCARVYAFEPYYPLADCVDEKIARNRLSNVAVHRVGLGERDARLAYFAPRGRNTGTGSFVATHQPGDNRPAETLLVRHADRLIEELAPPRIDIVKIDVEGFELRVLAGLRDTLARYRPIVLVELSDSARTELGNAERFMALLPGGYRVHVLDSRRPIGGIFARRGCSLSEFDWNSYPTRGGYVNLLLRP